MTRILSRGLVGVTISVACGAGLALAAMPAAAAVAPKTGWSRAVGGKLAVVNGQAEGVPAVFHWNGKGKWTITALTAIKESVVLPTAPTVDDLAQVPGTGQVWAPVYYDVASGPRDAILHYNP